GDPLGPVPDGRRPGALLDERLVELLAGRIRTARGVVLARGLGLIRAARRERIDSRLTAEDRAPAARRHLEDAHVVEGALARVELGILPDRTEVARPGLEGGAGAGIDAAAAARPRDVDHLLVRLTIAPDPALDDLDALERSARPSLRAGVGDSAHDEARAPRSADGPDRPAHRRPL